MKVRLALCSAAVCLASIVLAQVVVAQDAVKTDPKHYSVISENDQVRILKVHYGPHEKSIMHSHPNLAVVYLNDGKGTFTMPDGKKQDFTTKAGDAQFVPAGIHLPENTGDTGIDLILVELKTPAKSAMSMK